MRVNLVREEEDLGTADVRPIVVRDLGEMVIVHLAD